MDLAVNPFDDAIEEEEKKKVSDDAEDESDDSDDMDAELDALENSVQITADEDDVDTDEDADESKKVEQTDFTPQPRSVTRKASLAGRAGSGNTKLQGRQLLNQDDDDDGQGTFDTDHHETLEDEMTVEMDMEDTFEDGAQSSRKSLKTK